MIHPPATNTHHSANPCSKTECDLNWSMNVECKPPFALCCTNHSIQTATPAKHRIVGGLRGKGAGWILDEELAKAGTFIGEYTGEFINTAELARRELRRDPKGHFYTLNVSPDRHIDATHKGNETRFINHSCTPNAEYQTWEIDNIPRIGIYTTETLIKHSEITINYFHGHTIPKGKYPCKCGSANCSGWMGNPNRVWPSTKRNTTNPRPPTVPSFHDYTKQFLENYHPSHHDMFMAAHPQRPSHGRQDNETAYYTSDDMNDALEIHSTLYSQHCGNIPHPNPTYPRTLNMNTHFWQKFKAENLQYRSMRKWIRKIPTRELDIIYFMINHPTEIIHPAPTSPDANTIIIDEPPTKPSHSTVPHWSLIKIEIHTRKLKAYNSIRKTYPDIYEAILGWWFAHRKHEHNFIEHRSEWTISNPRAPQQTTGNTCGPHALCNHHTLSTPGIHPLTPPSAIVPMKLWFYQRILHSPLHTPTAPNPPPHRPHQRSRTGGMGWFPKVPTYGISARPSHKRGASRATHTTSLPRARHNHTQPSAHAPPTTDKHSKHYAFLNAKGVLRSSSIAYAPPRTNHLHQMPSTPLPPAPSPLLQLPPAPPAPPFSTPPPSPPTPPQTTTHPHNLQISAQATGLPNIWAPQDWDAERDSWIEIAHAAIKYGRSVLAVPSLPRAITHADHRIRIAFTAHTSWCPFTYSFAPEPYFVSSPRHLLQSLSDIGDFFREHDDTRFVEHVDYNLANELTMWAALTKQAIYTGIESLTTPVILSLSLHSHICIRHTISTHTTYNPESNTYGDTPAFLTSAHLLHSALVHLILLSETPEPSPTQNPPPHRRTL